MVGTTRVLLLNAGYEPLRLIGVKRAVVLLLQSKAELVEATEDMLRSQRSHMVAPLVIRLVRYIVVPRRKYLPCTRRFVLIRDRETCQYCGLTPGRRELTIDHVLPKMQGGGTTWDNVVAACAACNHKKGGRTPQQANMHLRTMPKQPAFAAIVLLQELQDHPVWSKYSFA